jgi:hypothetical protein
MNTIEEKRKKKTTMFYCKQVKDMQSCQESKKNLNKKI